MRKGIGMTQREGTSKGSGEGKLPPVDTEKVRPSTLDHEQLAVANEFFSTLDTSQLVIPEGQLQLVSDPVAKPKSAPAPSPTVVQSSSETEIVAELDAPREEIWDDVLTETLGSSLQQSLPSPTAAARKRNAKPKAVRKAIPMAKRTRRRRIEILEREDEPFLWRDLLTKKGLKKNMGFVISLVLHVILLLFLSLLVVRSGIGDSTLFLDIASAPAAEDEDLLDDFNLESVVFENEEIAETNELFEEILETEETEEVVELESLEDTDIPNGDLAQSRKSEGDGKSATFFGTKASGRRFVFVVDRSISMAYGSGDFVSNELFNRYDVAKSELLNAIESLQPHQEFYVVMFAHNTIPMFGQESVEDSDSSKEREFKMIAATRENKTRFQTWLSGVTMGPGTDPRLALEIAIDMEPDAVFMLSDGEFVSEYNDNRPKTRDIVRKHVRQGTIVPINTVSLVVEETVAAMKSIAGASRGSFKFTTIQDYIKQVADLRGPMRSRALEQLISSATTWEDREDIISNQLLPMLYESASVEVVNAESLLHRATMGLFEGQIDTVFQRKSKARTQWKEIIREIDGFRKTGQVSALGKDRALQEKLFLSMLEQKDDSFIGLFEKLDMSRASVVTKLEMIYAIDRVHREFGTSPESIGWLRELIARLKGKKPKERSQLSKTNWSEQQAEAAIVQLFEDRSKRARDIYRKYLDPKKGANLKDRLAEALVKKYPESAEAGRVRQKIAQQRSGEVPVAVENGSRTVPEEDPFAVKQ